MAKIEKSTFKSYLSQQEIDEDKTFKSYIHDSANQQSPKNTKPESPHKTSSTSYFYVYKDPSVLPGERVIAHADNVLRYSSFTGKKQGMSGTLYVTNFKITFITAERSALNSTQQACMERERNLLIGDMDIPLTGIDTIFQGFSGGKRKKILPGSTVSSKTKYLCVYCQNLRVHQFSFKFTPKDEDKQIMNAIVAFAFPNRPELLFALQYGQQSKHTECTSPTFTNYHDWEAELIRLGCDGWLSIQANCRYSLSCSLPEYFVIPHSVVVAELRESSKYYIDYRVPVWSYSFRDGASLVRMAYPTQDSDFNDNDKFIQAMTELHPSRSPPTVIDLGKLCPSARDLQQNFDKLKDLVIIDTVKDYWSTDVAWYTNLENTHWLQNVQTCLQVASQVVDELSENKNSVIIKETNSRDLCCVISSLAQLMLDPHYRTITGFQTLIQKEWVAMGHPFRLHSHIIKSDPANQTACKSPVFLLFLDCVWQLSQQFVASFEFTDTYLVTLWDSTHLGLFENFLFDSVYQRDKFCGQFQSGHSQYAVHLPDVWNWSLQYNSDDIALFKNPLFFLKTPPDVPNLGLHSRMNYALRLSTVVTDQYDESRSDRILRPILFATDIHLWKLCYLRWLAPGEIVNGGSQSGYLQQCLLFEEIVNLRHKVEVMASRAISARRPQSDLIFGQDNLNKSDLLHSSMITSSFPYSSASPRGQQSFVFTPLISYVDESRIKCDYIDSDD